MVLKAALRNLRGRRQARYVVSNSVIILLDVDVWRAVTLIECMATPSKLLKVALSHLHKLSIQPYQQALYQFRCSVVFLDVNRA